MRDNPKYFYPFLGPDDVYDFVYIVHGTQGNGRVARLYHDYPVCELLDGSGQHDNLEVFGKALVRGDDSLL